MEALPCSRPRNLLEQNGTAMGWFFGFKLHLPINHQGQIMTFKITGGKTDDRQPLESMTAALRARYLAIGDPLPSPSCNADGRGVSTCSLVLAAP